MKRYTIELVITEGSNEFWEDLETRSVTGCDDILEEVKGALAEFGLEPEIKLIKYEDK